MTTDAPHGIIRFTSPWSFNETVQRCEALFEAKKIKLFAKIDQAAEAAAIGLTLRPTTLLIFGDPGKGTPLMDASPSVALDLPLKALVWEAAPGEVYLALTSPEFLQQRHGLSHAPFTEVVSLFTTFLNSGASIMKAVSFRQQLPIKNPESLIDVVIDQPKLGPRDLLVQVRAISVNPVDTKIRKGSGPGQPSGELKILGWDAAGIVAEVGSDVTLFQAGDEVYYAGSVDRPGSYAEFQAVDERIVGKKPSSIDFADAAALPLTTITAWELLFDRMSVSSSTEATLLIIGGAGGVGSIAIQLAKKLTGLKVIATASRPETVAWCQKMGADYVIDHRQPLAAQVKKLVPQGVNYVLALTKTEDHWDEIIEAMTPEGAMGLIENVARPLDINKLKPKSLSLYWEFMFGRSRFQAQNMNEQGLLLNKVTELIDAGQIRSTTGTHLGLINAVNLQQAHALVESGKAIGKVVLAGF